MEPNPSSAAMPQIGVLSSFEPQTLEEDSGSNDCEGNDSSKTQESIRRGRPLGSRNKPKHDAVVYKDSDDTMMPHVVQIEDGADIVQCLHRLYRSLQVGALYVMSALGTVADVTISIAGSETQFPGIFQILSLCGSYLPDWHSLCITFVASKEQVVAGTVERILRAAGPVVIVAGSCVNPSLYRCRVMSPKGEGDENTGRTDRPFSQATGYMPSFDSCPENASPNSYQHHGNDPRATGYMPSLDSCPENASPNSYQHHANDVRAWLVNNPHIPPRP